MLNCRCCFQNLFLLLLDHWAKTSLLKAATSHSLPVHWLANLRIERKLTSVAVNGGYQQLSLWLVSAGGNRALSHAYKDLANNFSLLGVGALDSGAVAPGAKVWIFPHLSSTNISHYPKCSMEEGQLCCPLGWGKLKI